MNIYVGDGSKIGERVKNNHCTGNVEGSSLRKHIASNLGFGITKEKRPSGTTKVRLNIPNPKEGENKISNYLQSGEWKYLICETAEIAKDFQFYVIQNLFPQPLLNVNMGSWNPNNENMYLAMLQELQNCISLNYQETVNIPLLPGVYLFIHKNQPNEI
jgi:hypothetical protein